MATFVNCFLFFILGMLVSGHQANTGVSFDESVRIAVTRAVQWIKDQCRDDHSWGAFTPRAVVALALSQEVVPISKEEMTIMVKQLNIFLSLELGRNSSTKSMGLSRLALYVNALYSSCQDPRNFHGLDLVQILRSRTNAALANSTDFSLPVVFIPLCIAQDFSYDDVHRIIKLYHDHRNKTDLQALSLLSLCCISKQNRSTTINKYVESLVGDFLRSFPSSAPSSDVYTLALFLQVLSAASSSPVDVAPLIGRQSPDGSFGSLLGTYYAIPALLGKNIFTINKRHCIEKNSLGDTMSYPLSEPALPKVYYSIWIGEGNALDAHTLTVSPSPNGTLFEVMQVAQSRNPNFRFSYEEKNGSKYVYSIGGAPNDVQRELYWILYKTKGQLDGLRPDRLLHKITKPVDAIQPAAEDHFIFWFRRPPTEV